MERKQMIAIGVMPLAVVLVSWQAFAIRRTANHDLDNLKAQREANGMPDPEKMRAKMLDDLAKDLSLTNEQKQKFSDIQQASMEKMRGNFKPGQKPSEEDRAKFQAARAETDAQLKAILTPDQQVKYEERQKKMREQRGKGRGGPGGPGGPGGMGGMMGGGPPPGGPGGMGGPPPDGKGGPPPNGAN